MNRRRRREALACLLALACCFAPRAARAQSGLSLTINQSDGVNDRVASGRDYATETLADPWDMNDATDVNLTESSGISNATYANGIFSATAATNDPALFLLDPGIAGSQRDGRTGKNFPIDTTTYRVFSMRMNVSVASSYQVFWYTTVQGQSFAASAIINNTSA